VFWLWGGSRWYERLLKFQTNKTYLIFKFVPTYSVDVGLCSVSILLMFCDIGYCLNMSNPELSQCYFRPPMDHFQPICYKPIIGHNWIIQPISCIQTSSKRVAYRFWPRRMFHDLLTSPDLNSASQHLSSASALVSPTLASVTSITSWCACVYSRRSCSIWQLHRRFDEC